MQGVLHCYLRLIRLHLEHVHTTAEYLLPEIQYIAALATDSLKHTDSNVVVSALELLQELLSSFLPVLIHVWTPERARDRFKALLDQFEVMLFEDSAVRISSQSLIVACVAHIFEHYWIDYAHLSRDHTTASAVPSTVVTFEPLSMFLESKLTKWSSLLTHADPQLRGQAALFVAATQSAVLINPRAPPGPEPLGAWAAQPLLQLILDDESSVAAKWGGQALAQLWPALVAHAPPALPLSVLARILAVKSDAYLLVKIKVYGGIFPYLSTHTLFAGAQFSVARRFPSNCSPGRENSTRQSRDSNWRSGTFTCLIRMMCVNMLAVHQPGHRSAKDSPGRDLAVSR